MNTTNTIVTTSFQFSFFGTAMQTAIKKFSLSMQYTCLVVALLLVGMQSVYSQTPTITSLSASSGAAGSLVRLTGTNLNAVTAVRFFGVGGTQALVFSSTATSLLVSIPTNAVGFGQIYVENASGNVSSAPFGIISTPATISQFGNASVRVLGQTGYGVSTTGLTSNRFNYPHAVSVHPATGKVFVADRNNNRVLRFASFSELTDGADAEVVFGQASATTNAITPFTDHINNPEGIYVDGAGNLWIADTGHRRVLRYDGAVSIANGSFLLANQANFLLGQPDFSSNLSGITRDRLNYPIDLTVDESTGTLWVLDQSAHRALRYDNIYSRSNGQINADAVLGQADYESSTANRGTGANDNTLSSPAGITIHNGTLYIADLQNNRVLWFDNARLKSNGDPANGVLGQEDFTSSANNRGVAPAANSMLQPAKVAVEASGNVWVAEYQNRRVLRYSTPITNGKNASLVLGQGGVFTTFTAGSSNAGLGGARSVALDAMGRPYIIDNENHRLVIYDSAPSTSLTVSVGSADFGSVTQNTVSTQSITLTIGNVSSGERFSYSIMGANAGDFSLGANTGFTTSANATSFTTTVTVSFQPTAGGVRTAGLVISTTGTPMAPTIVGLTGIGEVAPTTTVTVNVSTLNFGTNTASGSATTQTVSILFGNIASGERVTYTLGGTNVSNFTANTSGFSTNATQTTFSTSVTVTFTPGSGVGTSVATLTIGLAGTTATTVVNLTASVTAPPATPTITSLTPTTIQPGGTITITGTNFSRTSSVTIGGAGVYRYWVSSPTSITAVVGSSFIGSGNVVVTTPNGVSNTSAITVNAGTVYANAPNSAVRVLGQSNYTTRTGGNGVGNIQNPNIGAVDPTTGKVFVVEYDNNRVLRFANYAALTNGIAAEAVLGQTGFGTNATGNGAAQMDSPIAVHVDGAGRLWVADWGNHRVLRFDNAASKENGSSANGVLGQPGFGPGNNQTTANGMWNPGAVFADGGGRLWVSDLMNNRILRFDNAGSKANGGSADGVLGQTEFTTRTGALGAGGLNEPLGLAVSGNGTLWVADRANKRILRYNNAAGKGNGGSADAVLGQVNFSTNTGGVTQSKFNVLSSIALDGAGRLWVGEFNSSRVLRFDNAETKSGEANADAVLGQPNFTSSSSGLAQNRFFQVKGVWTDDAGLLWIADSDNNRVLTFDYVAPAPATTVTVNVSTLNFGTSTASGGTTTQTVNITFGNIANGERVTYALGGTNSANFTANTSGFSTNATQTTFSTSVTVTFTPGSGVGTSVATLTIGLAGTTATTVVNLTANVVAPTPATTVTVNVSTLNFGNQNIGATGTQTVVLTIANVQAGERFSYSVSGTQASEFSIGNNFGFTTSATSTQFSTSITLSFTAGGVGTRSATLAIAVGGAPNAGTTVGLSGIGVALPQPSITSLSAVSAQRGESITITGTNLSNATAVRFFGANGVDATIQSNTATQLVVTVPNIVGSGAIFVQTTINSANSSTFTINAQPVVQTVPATLVAGQSATLGGLNLDLVSSVSIGGVSASITSQTRTSLVLGVPATLSSSGLQSLVVSGTTGTATANVNVIAIPTVTALSATSAGVGSTITLTGTNLNQLTAVRFFGANGTLASIVSSSATQVVVTVPSGASALQGQIFVQNPAGSALSGNFTVILLPTITGITPLVTTTGQTITITGTNLADITAVRFFGASGVAGIIQSQNVTQVVVAVPAGITAISGTITVVNAGGSIASVEELAIVARPVITGLSSTQIALGGQITLNGANLDRITEVRFFGSSGATGTIVSQTPTQLVATAPMQLSLRSGSIFLRNIAGTAESQTVIVVAQPTITGASPLPTYAGQTLTIAGTNFTGVNSVRFFGTNGVTANIVSLTDTQATVIVPSGSAQLGQIVMSNVAGSGFSEAITLLQPPSITTVPESATAGSEITIVGSNFDALRSVRFFGTNGVSGTILSSSATQIRVRIPTEGITTASGQIAVENAVGIGLSSTQTRLLSAPIISRVLVGGTTRTLVQEGETITVIGENFDQVTTVRIFGQNGTSVDFNRQGSTTIQFAMPTGSYGQSGQVALTNAIGTGLTTILTVGRPPTITAVQPSTFEPGQDVTIAGTDLQFVTTIRFFGATGTTATIRSRASDNRSITVTVPLGRGAGRVFAENILGSGQSTSDVAYRVFAPGVPTAVNVGSITSSSATLTFSTPSTGSDPAQFEVRIAPNATIAPSTILFSATTRTYTVQLTNLGAGSSYKVEVRAVNTAGSSPWVSADFTTQLAPGPVNVPTNLRITQADANSASLAWNPPTGGGSPVRYTLQWRWVIDENIANASPTSGTFSTLQVDRFNNTARVTDLNFAQNVSVLVANVRQTRSVRVRYEFSVRAENAFSQSAFTPVVIQRVPAEPPPSPTTLTARDITSSSFIAQANVVGSQLSSVTWELFSSENNFAQPIQSITNPQTSSGQIRQTFTGVRFGVNYYFTVVARNIGGPSAVARLTPNFTALPSTPGTPQLLNATSIGATGFVANWLAVGGTGGAPDGFEIQRATGTQAIDNATIVNVANKDARNFTFENLGPDLVQRWRIRAYNNNRSGFSAWSDVVTTNLIDLRRLDSVALTRIFTDGGGANWTNRTGWNTTSRMDQWYGVTIENNRVVALRLGNNNVRAISPAIRQLAFLRTLSLWGNTLTTLPVDSLAVLTRLQRLELDYNQITAFNVNLSALTNLRFLRLNNNNISSLGTSVFTASSALRVVRLDNNALTGPVPQQIFNLNDLRVLNMANNGLTSFAGNVAKWNGSLTHISLNRNALTTLPNFTGASGLMQFNVAQNRLSASALQVNVSLDNIARVTYVATPQTTVVAGQSALLSDMSDMLTPNASSTDVNSPQEFRVIERKAEIYPNPARDEAIVSFPVEEEGAIHIMITDVLGRIVYNEHLLPLIQPIMSGNTRILHATIRLDVRVFTAGRYSIAIRQKNPTAQTLRSSFMIIR